MSPSVHVLPLHDVIDHHVPGGLDGHEDELGRWLMLEAEDGEDMDCPCGVTPELVPNEDGPDGWLYTHHSLDGREQHEDAP